MHRSNESFLVVQEWCCGPTDTTPSRPGSTAVETKSPQNLIHDTAPARGEPIMDIHSNAANGNLAIGAPGKIVEITSLFYGQFPLTHKSSFVIEIANVVLPSKPFRRTSSRNPRSVLRI